MRISDWSSDVCSSDLKRVACGERPFPRPRAGAGHARRWPAGRGEGYRNEIRRSLRQVENPLRIHLAIGGGSAGHVTRHSFEADRKSTRLNSSTNAHLVCRLLLEKKKTNQKRQTHER